MAEFYARTASHVDLLGNRAEGWRPPQIGALGATMAHWSVSPREPIIVSIPTGSGKTAIGLAAPFVGNRSSPRTKTRRWGRAVIPAGPRRVASTETLDGAAPEQALQSPAGEHGIG